MPLLVTEKQLRIPGNMNTGCSVLSGDIKGQYHGKTSDQAGFQSNLPSLICTCKQNSHKHQDQQCTHVHKDTCGRGALDPD